jgi:hypothetical protein
MCDGWKILDVKIIYALAEDLSLMIRLNTQAQSSVRAAQGASECSSMLWLTLLSPC